MTTTSFQDDFHREVERQAQEARQTDWQPIETAPKDGTTVDLWVKGTGRSQMRSPSCSYKNGSWISPMHGDWAYGSGRMMGVNPTHWQPLPSPPKQDIHGRGNT